jgi:hypothetical protein
MSQFGVARVATSEWEYHSDWAQFNRTVLEFGDFGPLLWVINSASVLEVAAPTGTLTRNDFCDHGGLVWSDWKRNLEVCSVSVGLVVVGWLRWGHSSASSINHSEGENGTNFIIWTFLFSFPKAAWKSQANVCQFRVWDSASFEWQNFSWKTVPIC